MFLLRGKPLWFSHNRVSITVETLQSNPLSSKRARWGGGTGQPQLPAYHSLHPMRAGSSRCRGKSVESMYGPITYHQKIVPEPPKGEPLPSESVC